MRALVLPSLALLCLLPLNSAMADKGKGGYGWTMKEGQTMLSISATESMNVTQDLLVATLRYEAKNKDLRALQNDINKTMEKVLETARKEGDVNVTTLQYNVHEYTPPRPRDLQADDWEEKNRVWKGQQSLQLKSQNADALLALSGELQDMGLAMNTLSYTLSPKKAAETEDDLMEDALAKLQERALRAAKALGKTKAELRHVKVMHSGMPQHPTPMGRMQTMMMEAIPMSAPVAEAGEARVNLTVSAKAVLE